MQATFKPAAAAAETVMRVFAMCGLGLLTPLLLAIAIAIILDDGLPVFFRQTRVGRDGKPFQLFKFRSMRIGAAGSPVTAAGDSRVTRIGAVIRHYKFDELPQLWNVVRGDMCLVGPRPEIPEYVTPGDPMWHEVLSRKPGITDLATLVYRNEEQLLGTGADPGRYYREVVLPSKLALSVAYSTARSFRSDVLLVLLTLWYSLRPSHFDPEHVRNAVLKS